jgi:hypothetical protein
MPSTHQHIKTSTQSTQSSTHQHIDNTSERRHINAVIHNHTYRSTQSPTRQYNAIITKCLNLTSIQVCVKMFWCVDDCLDVFGVLMTVLMVVDVSTFWCVVDDCVDDCVDVLTVLMTVDALMLCWRHCVDDCVDVLMCWDLDVLISWWLRWCLDVLSMCWCVDYVDDYDCVDDCVDVLMCWSSHYVMNVLMSWYVDVLMCRYLVWQSMFWCVDVPMSWWLCWCVSVSMCWCVSIVWVLQRVCEPVSMPVSVGKIVLWKLAVWAAETSVLAHDLSTAWQIFARAHPAHTPPNGCSSLRILLWCSSNCFHVVSRCICAFEVKSGRISQLCPGVLRTQKRTRHCSDDQWWTRRYRKC